MTVLERMLGAVWLVAACGQSSTEPIDNPADADADGQSSITAGFDQCPPVPSEAALGFGMGAEGQCAPAEYSGAARVASVELHPGGGGSADYYIELSDAPVLQDCPWSPRVWLYTLYPSTQLPLEAGQEFHAEFSTEVDLMRYLYVYVVLTDPVSGELTYAHYNYDDRFFESGELALPSNLRFSLEGPCVLNVPCYIETVRYHLVEAQHGVFLGAFESTTLVEYEREFKLYFVNARQAQGFVDVDGSCGTAHHNPGITVHFDIVAYPR